MLDLRRWSIARLIVSSFLWIVVVVLVCVGYVALQIFIQTRGAGAAGVGTVFFGIDGWLALAVLFGPPLIVSALWIARRGPRRS
jgi:hypothetical protein